jgi:hypothetical protein
VKLGTCQNYLYGATLVFDSAGILTAAEVKLLELWWLPDVALSALKIASLARPCRCPEKTPHLDVPARWLGGLKITQM